MDDVLDRLLDDRFLVEVLLELFDFLSSSSSSSFFWTSTLLDDEFDLDSLLGARFITRGSELCLVLSRLFFSMTLESREVLAGDCFTSRFCSTRVDELDRVVEDGSVESRRTFVLLRVSRCTGDLWGVRVLSMTSVRERESVVPRWTSRRFFSISVTPDPVVLIVLDVLEEVPATSERARLADGDNWVRSVARTLLTRSLDLRISIGPRVFMDTIL